jgi:hypothetical protein
VHIWDEATDAGWVAYSPALAWTLPAGDGPKTVRAQFRDAAGNLSRMVEAHTHFESEGGDDGWGEDYAVTPGPWDTGDFYLVPRRWPQPPSTPSDSPDPIPGVDALALMDLLQRVNIEDLVPTQTACDPGSWQAPELPPLDPDDPLKALSAKHFYLFDLRCSDFQVYQEVQAVVPHPIVPGRMATIYFALSTSPNIPDWGDDGPADLDPNVKGRAEEAIELQRQLHRSNIPRNDDGSMKTIAAAVGDSSRKLSGWGKNWLRQTLGYSRSLWGKVKARADELNVTLPTHKFDYDPY